MAVTRITGINSGLDTDSIVKAMSSAYSLKKDKTWKQKKKLEMKQDAWKDLNKDIYGFYSGILSKARLSSSYKSKEITLSNDKVAKVNGKINGQHNLKVNQTASKTYVTGAETEGGSVNVSGSVFITTSSGTREVNITAGMSMKEVAASLTKAGIEANFDSNNNRFFLSSTMSGAASDFSISGNAGVLDAIGLGAASIKQVGTDASIELNGATFTSTTNEFNINGISISALSQGSTSIDIQDNDGIFNTVKEFIEEYNKLIEKIDTKRNTSAKGYEPLTDDEKYSMSDKQIEDWEKKIIEGIFYKDETLNNISSKMRNTMMSSFDDSTLSSFGIKRKSYFLSNDNNHGVYDIDEDKLKESIKEDPDKVVSFMTKLANKLYDTIDKEMKSTSMRSAYTIYNDKQMQKDINNYEKQLTKWDDKISAIEDKYYKQFATMEKMLAATQSQSNYLSSYFG